MIELRKITILSDEMKDCIALDIAPEKKKFVYSNAVMLALGHEYNRGGEPMDCYAIYAGGKPVGMIAYNYFVDAVVYKETCYRIRPIMIDKNHLGKGYEAVALEKVLEKIQAKPHGEAAAVFATHNPKEADMVELYNAANFIKTDLNWDEENPDNNDIILRRAL